MDKEKLVLLVVGVLLVVAVMQAFQLSGLVKAFSDAAKGSGGLVQGAAAASGSGGAGNAQAPAGAPLKVAQPPAMVGGC